MGGKNKPAQRRKNNARPSSSGRSAELLASNMPDFSGFSAAKEGTFAIGAFSQIEEPESSIDSNFQLVFKKMNKKDSTTKLKALIEFAQLIKSSDADVLSTLLPHWPRVYNMLATDTDHRVREAVHIAHNELVLKVKKSFAPILKQLVGSWFTSQYDTYPPAASAAKVAFESAFPSNKMQDAIAFCQEEILQYITENLTVHTAQTLSNQKTTSFEDSEAKYERVIIASLQGYALYLNKINKETFDKCRDLNQNLLQNQKFWKLAKHCISPIRSAWYSVISELCIKAPDILNQQHSQLVLAVLNGLDESEPSVIPKVWEAVLLTITCIDEWYKYINIEKMFFPKLWHILREGGQGSATVVYKHFLPLISHIPNTVDHSAFYTKFFENMRSGLKQKNVILSRSETAAITTSLIECLRYVILKNQLDNEFCNNLIRNQIIPLIEWSFFERNASYKTIFNQIALLIQYWNRNRENADVVNYHKYIKTFWDSLKILYEELLAKLAREETSDAMVDIAEKQVEFLICLKQTARVNKTAKVIFSDSNLKLSRSSTDNVSSIDDFYMNHLMEVVYKLGEILVKHVNNLHINSLIECLYTLLDSFDSDSFIMNFIANIDKSGNCNTVITFYKLITQWLKYEKPSKATVDLIFLLMKCLNNDEKQMILDDLIRLENEPFVWSLTKAISYPHKSNNLIQKWLRNKKIGDFLNEIVAKELVHESNPELRNILKQSMAVTDKDELIIDRKALNGVLTQLAKFLKNPDSNLQSVDSCVRLSVYISTIIYSDSHKLIYGKDLLLAIFEFTCQFNEETDFLSADTIWECNTAWQDAISFMAQSLTKEDFLSLVEGLIDIIETYLLTSNVKKIQLDHFIEHIGQLMQCTWKSNTLLLGPVIEILINRKAFLERRNKLTIICTLSEYLSGNKLVKVSEFDTVDLIKPCEFDILIYFLWKRILGNALCKEIDEEEDESDLIINLVTCKVNVVADLFYDITLGTLYLKYFNLLKYSRLIESELSKMKAVVAKFSQFDDIIQILYNKHHTDGNIWSEAANAYAKENNKEVKQSPEIFNTQMDLIDKLLYFKNEMAQFSIEIIDKLFVEVRIVMKTSSKEMSMSNWKDMALIIEIIEFCHDLLEQFNFEVYKKYWDFIVLSLASWAPKLNSLKTNIKNIQVSRFMIAVLKLYNVIESKLGELRTEDPNHEYISEWNDLFSCTVQENIILAWYYAMAENHSEIYLNYIPLMMAFYDSLTFINYKYIFKSTNENLPKWSKLTKLCCQLLTQNNYLQLMGHQMMLIIVQGLVEIDGSSVDKNMPHAKGLIIEQFKDIVQQTQDIVQAAYMDYKLGEDSCRVEPYTDCFTFTLAYCLTWDILMSLCENASTELKFQYSDWLKKEEFLDHLLNNLFKLMPLEVFEEIKPKNAINYFVTKPCINLKIPYSSEMLENLVCWIYTCSLINFPALVRQWWTLSIEPRTVQLVDRVTSNYISTFICNQELSAVGQNETKFKNMKIKVLKQIRTVKAIYTVEESQMELSITLPVNYPLGSPDIQCNREIGGSSHRQWLMQLKMCILHQNTRIWDGLALWNHNLDKKFEGVEECYICFSVLHPGTYQLPKLSCQTCRKKFHSACLYKWFSTSNKSTCPICRNLF